MASRLPASLHSPVFHPPATRSARLRVQSKHKVSLLQKLTETLKLVMRLERNPDLFLSRYSDRNGGGCIPQKANIHKEVFNAHIMEILNSLLDHFRGKLPKYEIISDRKLFGTGNMRIDRYLPRESACSPAL